MNKAFRCLLAFKPVCSCEQSQFESLQVNFLKSEKELGYQHTVLDGIKIPTKI